MQYFQLDPNALIGGILAEDADQQIVQLNLQKGNEVPAYEADAIITLIVLSGRANIQTATGKQELSSLQMARFEPYEQHTIQALEDKTLIVVIKQLTHQLGLARKIRFGQCCL